MKFDYVSGVVIDDLTMENNTVIGVFVLEKYTLIIQRKINIKYQLDQQLRAKIPLQVDYQVSSRPKHKAVQALTLDSSTKKKPYLLLVFIIFLYIEKVQSQEREKTNNYETTKRGNGAPAASLAKKDSNPIGG